MLVQHIWMNQYYRASGLSGQAASSRLRLGLMASLDQRFDEYESYHTSRGNRLTHAIGIPAIAFALFGLASKIELVHGAVGLDLGILLVAGLGLLYLRWHPGLAAFITALSVLLYLGGARLSVLPLWGILAGGVALQVLGHLVFERNRPAFYRNAIHMLVGPLWVASLLLRHVGLYRPVGQRSGPISGTRP